MVEQKPSAEEKNRRVVLSRIRAAGNGAPSPPASDRVSLALTLTPLLIGFALLVGLVMGLGVLSVGELKTVSNEVLDDERQYAHKLKVLLRMQVALTRLNNEARARARAESEGGVISPFDLPLRNARREVIEVMERWERLALAQTDRGRAFSLAVSRFLETTRDLDQFSLNGYAGFRDVEAELDRFMAETTWEQEDIQRFMEEDKERAVRRINFLTILAVLMGLVVTALTVWEVRRRFRQIRVSLNNLRREREFSTQMLEGMVSAVAAIDQDNRIRSANEAFFELFPETAPGTSLNELPASDESKILAAVTAARVKRATYHGRWLLVPAPDGKQRAFDIYSSPLAVDGERGRILTLVDVTEVAETESELRRQESLAAVGQATAQVAHEIKNPLGSIRLGVAMLRDMTDDREAITTINLVDRGIEHLSKLTSDVTQFSRRRELTLDDVDLDELLDSSLDLVADKITEKNTPIEKQFSTPPIILEGDDDQLRQVLVNLFANAIDASGDSSPVTVTTERVTSERKGPAENSDRQTAPAARITISDAGAGMDEATRARIFEPFFTTKKRGTGLGLAIAKQIIEQHGGHISVKSAPGKGTSFIIELPLTNRASRGGLSD